MELEEGPRDSCNHRLWSCASVQRPGPVAVHEHRAGDSCVPGATLGTQSSAQCH